MRLKFIVVCFFIIVLSITIIGCSTNNNSQTQLSIASFQEEIRSEDTGVLANLHLNVNNYWVEDNRIRCNGTVEWHKTGNTISGLNICMYILENQHNSVNVKIVVYGGILVLDREVIDFDSVSVPELNDQSYSYDFSLLCVYQ